LNAKGYANDGKVISLVEGRWLLIRKEVFVEVGLLNEKFFLVSGW